MSSMNFQTIGSKVASNEGAPLHIESPDGWPLYAKPIEGNDGKFELTIEETELPCRLFCVSEDSTPFRRRKAELWKRRISGKGKLRSFTEAEEEDLKTITAGVVNWENIVWADDEILEYNDQNVMEFLDGYRHAFDQANTFIGDRSNFFAMPKSS